MTQRHAVHGAAGAHRAPVLPHRQRVRAEDAFFLYAESANVPQVVGGFVVFDGHVGLPQVRERVAERLPDLPNLRRRPVVGRIGWWRPRWLLQETIDVDAHVTECALGPGATLHDAVDEFFSSSVRLDRPPWALRLIQEAGGARTALLVKLHHALGDGFAAVHSMLGLLDGPGDTLGAAARKPAPPTSPRGRAADRLRSASRLAYRTLTGVWSLARAGAAPLSPLSGLTSGPKRRYVPLLLDAETVRAAASAHRTRTNDLLLAVLGEGLHRFLAHGDAGKRPRTVRAMVPRTLRTARTWHLPGNVTAAVSLDLPLEAMPAARRLGEIRERAAGLIARGQPEATRFVIKAMGVLPAPVHAWAARNAYNSHWFNLIVSVIPGPPRTQYLRGVRLAEVYPVLPVTSGVGLAIGLMRWGGTFTVGLTVDPDMIADADDLATAIREALAAYLPPPQP